MEHLIPFERIVQSGTAGIGLLFLIIIISIAILCKGADWLVEGTAQSAYRLGIPKIIVGATVVSLGTTSPEAAVFRYSQPSKAIAAWLWATPSVRSSVIPA